MPETAVVLPLVISTVALVEVLMTKVEEVAEETEDIVEEFRDSMVVLEKVAEEHVAEDVTVVVTVMIHKAGQFCVSCRRLGIRGLAPEKAEMASTIVPPRTKLKPIAVVV